MEQNPGLVWQPSLLDVSEVGFDESFSTLERIRLDDSAWLDYAPGWVSGSDELFDQVVASQSWSQRKRRMYDRQVLEPRLTALWNLASGEPLVPEIIEDLRRSLSARYEAEFDSVGFNLYRGGDDSVAWHGDRIRKDIEEPIVALVSLGEPRRFLLRPKGGRTDRAFALGRGDLLVTGGTTQRTWEHSVPKVAKASPRISLAFRHGLDPNAYSNKESGARP